MWDAVCHPVFSASRNPPQRPSRDTEIGRKSADVSPRGQLRPLLYPRRDKISDEAPDLATRQVAAELKIIWLTETWGCHDGKATMTMASIVPGKV